MLVQMHGFLRGFFEFATGSFNMGEGFVKQESLKLRGGAGDQWMLWFLFFICAFILALACYTWFWKKKLCWTIFFLSVFTVFAIIYIVFLTSHNNGAKL